jgi:hypothetical protein
MLWDAPESKNNRCYRKSKRANNTNNSGRGLSREDMHSSLGGWFPTTKTTHFAGLPIRSKMVGVCTECGLGEDKCDDEVILCDGPGCDREFHLKCCRPPLAEVPEDDEYYCFDCQPNGGYATNRLEEYLDDMEENRESHKDQFLWDRDELLALTTSRPENHATTSVGGGGETNSLGTTTNGKALCPSKNPLISPSRRTRRIPQSKKNHDSDETSTPAAHNNGNGSGTERKKSSPSIGSDLTFVDQLLCEDMELHQPELLSRITNGICMDATGKGLPRSELEVFHRNKPESYNHAEESDDPLLVGCALRLFCPKTNHYHTGRILKLREPPDNRDPNEIVRDDYDRNHDTECLVRFQAGRDHRKKSLTRWIRLEEHSLAVAYPYLVWGKFKSSELDQAAASRNSSPTKANKEEESSTKKRKSSSSPSPNKYTSQNRWVPTKLWMRSSRELVMSMQLLEESLGQIGCRDFRHFTSSSSATDNSTATTPQSNGKNQRSSPRQSSSSQDLDTGTTGTKNATYKSPPYLQQKWILAECIGRGLYALLHVPTETREYCHEDYTNSCGSTSPKAARSPGKNGGSKKSPKKNTSHLSTKPRENEIMSALVQAEQEERSRIRSWNKLPLQYAWHKKALTSLDEFALGPLPYDASYNHKMNTYGTKDNCETQGETEHSDENYGEASNNGEKTIHIQPTPLVRTGLDRMYIMEKLVTHYNKTQEKDGNVFHRSDVNGNNSSGIDDGLLRGTKDLVMSLSSELVSNHCITACIQKQNRMARLRWDQHGKNEKFSVESLSLSEPKPFLIEADAIATSERNTTIDDQASELDKTKAVEAATGREPKTAKAIFPKEESRNVVMRNVVMSRKRSSLSQSPTSSTGITLLVGDETEANSSGLLEGAHTETISSSTAVAPSVPGPEMLLSKESKSAVSTSVPASS